MKGNHVTYSEYSFAKRGYAVVVVSEICDHQRIASNLSSDVKVITHGYLIRDSGACVYDTILAERMVREAFDHAQENKNFIKGANRIIKFNDFLRIA